MGYTAEDVIETSKSKECSWALGLLWIPRETQGQSNPTGLFIQSFPAQSHCSVLLRTAQNYFQSSSLTFWGLNILRANHEREGGTKLGLLCTFLRHSLSPWCHPHRLLTQHIPKRNTQRPGQTPYVHVLAFSRPNQRSPLAPRPVNLGDAEKTRSMWQIHRRGKSG